ncbi:unnamed protein product [Penicillium olsonii]|uniref:Zn(2)-C6 fungal-type domain-containing protein n=1 Tax=Penicillium olsonii TaxID=99116 RepID=A0A9W4I0C5_PENOL|nr:unnamed protein product [Penicillium olsonii]CAG8200824.1 unnamed protein product [Penicillium olsonii]
MDSPKTTASSTVACLNCRDKHLKCDGNPEGCDRCRVLSLFCHFVPSRRGRRGQPSQLAGLDSCPIPVVDESPFFDSSSLPLEISGVLSPEYIPGPPQRPFRLRIHLIKAFYEYFHSAHPIFPPYDLWISSSPPQYLVDIVELIGLHHASPGQVTEFPNDIWIATGQAELALEKVQSYLFLCILFHGRNVPDLAKKCIGLAIECSFGLGLHFKEVSDAVEIQNPARAESMRRTLWEVFVVDTLLATMQVGGTLQFNMETPDVPLPSRDESFTDGHSGLSQISAKDLDFSELFDDGCMSPLAYRVEATLLLRQCLFACENHAGEDDMERLDTRISAWFHRWPNVNGSILQMNGKVDQIDFQSAMIMQCASIHLHFPRSLLVLLLPTTGEIFCSRPPPISSPSSNTQTHTAKIVNAASELSKLASLSTSVRGHTPFFACSLVLSSIVQVAALAVPTGQPIAKQRSFVVLNLGVLKSMSQVWNIASISFAKLRAIVREVRAASTEAGGQIVDSTISSLLTMS